MWDWQPIRRQSSRDTRLASVEVLEVRWLLSGASGPISIGLSSTPLQYVEKEGAAPIDPTLTISDSNDAMLGTASVELLGFVADEDSLSAPAESGITVSWNSSTGVLTMSGEASVAVYQNALESVTYTDGSDDPATSPRIAQVSVTDSQSASGSASRFISITAVNDPPSVQTPAVQTTAAGVPIVFSAAAGNSIVISDVDANGAAEEVILTASDGTLELSQSAGLSFVNATESGSATIAMMGTLDAINTALKGLTFTPSSPYADQANLEVSADDLGNSGIGGAQIVNAIVPIVVTGAPAPSVAVGDSVPSSPPSPPVVGASPPSSEPQSPGSAPTAPQPPIVAVRPAAPIAEIAAASGAVMATFQISNSLQPVPSDSARSLFVDRSSTADQRLPTLATSERPKANLSNSVPMPMTVANRSSSNAHSSVFADRLISAAEGLSQTESNFSFSSRPWRPSHFAFRDRVHAATRSFTALSDTAGFLRELDLVRARIVSDLGRRFWAGGASLITAGASIAYFLWMVRGGSLFSGLLSAIPAWNVIDPLPILDQVSNAAAALKQGEDRDLETLISATAGN